MRDLAVGAVVAALLAGVYAPLSHGNWPLLSNFDDNHNFVDNDMITTLNGTSVLRWLTEARIGVWEPASFALKAALFAAAGAGGVGHAARLAALVTHAGHALLVGAVAARVVAARAAARGEAPPPRGRVAAARAIAAAVFAVHPLAVEVVMWPSSTPYAAAGLLYTAAVWVYLRAAYGGGDGGMDIRMGGGDGGMESPVGGGGGADGGAAAGGPPARLSPRATIALAACFVGAGLSKSIAVTLPLALACLDVGLMVPRAAGALSPAALLAHAARRTLTQAPLLSCMAALVMGAVAANTHATGTGTIQHDMVELDAGQRLLRAALMPWAYAARCERLLRRALVRVYKLFETVWRLRMSVSACFLAHLPCAGAAHSPTVLNVAGSCGLESCSPTTRSRRGT